MFRMEHVLGQPRAIDVIQKQLASGRLHHAWVFHGPAGVGKFTTAIAFARVLLCHDRTADLAGRVGACGACASCRALDAAPDDGGRADEASLGSAHPDLHVITKELARYDDDAKIRNAKLRAIPVDVVRHALIEPANRSAQLADGRFGKVFVVDEAELLNPADAGHDDHPGHVERGPAAADDPQPVPARGVRAAARRRGAHVAGPTAGCADRAEAGGVAGGFRRRQPRPGGAGDRVRADRLGA